MRGLPCVYNYENLVIIHHQEPSRPVSKLENIIYELKEEYIELFKLLKICNLVESGGQAKFLIADGLVQVNDEEAPETRKRFKVRKNTLVHFDGQTIEVQ